MRWMVWLGLLIGFGGIANAQEAAVLNDPPAFVGVMKDAINRLDPSYETVWLVSDGTFSQGVSAALYQVKSATIPVASLRIGTGTNANLYGGISADLPGMAKRWVPTTVQGIAMTGPLDVLWSMVGKYARVGVISGYSWGDNKPIYGFSAGAALSF